MKRKNRKLKEKKSSQVTENNQFAKIRSQKSTDGDCTKKNEIPVSKKKQLPAGFDPISLSSSFVTSTPDAPDA